MTIPKFLNNSLHNTFFWAMLIGVGGFITFLTMSSDNYTKKSKASVLGTEYYVSQSGSNTNPGTKERPWKNILYGFNKMTPGDTLYVRQGVYNEKLSLSRSGSATSRLTVKAYPGERPAIDGTGVFPSTGTFADRIIDISGSYVTLSGFEIRNSNSKGIGIYGNYNIIENNIVHGMKRYGISTYNSGSAPRGNIIRNNEVYNTMMKNVNGVNYIGGWDANIAIHNSVETTVENNYVHNVWGEGIMSYDGSVRTIIRNNTVHDSWGVLIYLAGSSETIVENNHIYDSTPFVDTAQDRRKTPVGFAMNTESENCNNKNNIIRNNLLVGGRSGITYMNYSANNTARRTACTGFMGNIVENNTFYNPSEESIKIQEGKNTGNVFRNNILMNSSRDLIYYNNPNPAYGFNYVKPVFESNVFYAPGRNTARIFRWNQDVRGMGNANTNPIFQSYIIDPPLTNRQNLMFEEWSNQANSLNLGTVSGNKFVDPQFVNPSVNSTNPLDFALKPGSAAIGAGANVTLVGRKQNNTPLPTTQLPTQAVSPTLVANPTITTGFYPTSTPSANSSVAITSFSLINADTDREVSGMNSLTQSTTISLAQMGLKNINVRANTTAGVVGVKFELNNNLNFNSEEVAPFSLAKDVNGDYFNWTPTVGTYRIKAIPYAGKNFTLPGKPLEFILTVVQNMPPTATPTPAPNSAGSVTQFNLINADTNLPVIGYLSLMNTVTMNRTSLPTRNLTLQAVTSPNQVGSVVFLVNGAVKRTENLSPYGLDGTNGSDFYSNTFNTAGTYTIEAIPYSGIDATGTKGVSKKITITIN